MHSPPHTDPPPLPFPFGLPSTAKTRDIAYIGGRMLAYVFWHWPRADLAAAAYERAQRAFHAALQAAPPPGFARSTSAAVRGLPWAAAGAHAYEDWYLLREPTALDALNTAAITASRAAPHDAAAALAAGGTAGLYRLRAGESPAAPRHAAWFAKPDGMSYAALDAAIMETRARHDAALWMRYMVLGPGPEFCLQSLQPLVLPPPFEAVRTVELRRVWPSGT